MSLRYSRAVTPIELSRAEVQSLCEAGATAPSPANLQAWKVTVDGPRFDLWLDDALSSSFLDIKRYASVFALGSFAENVAIAARQRGLVPSLERLPYDDVRAPVARFTFSRGAAAEEPLYPHIFTRVTNRKPGDGSVVPDEMIEALRRELQADGHRLTLATITGGEAKQRYEHALALAENIRMYDDEMRRQMFGEVCWGDEEMARRQVGLPLATLEAPAPVVWFMRLLKRAPWLMKLTPKKAMEKSWIAQLEPTSHLCCISVDGKLGPASCFEGGRAVQRLWLRATALGLSVHPWVITPYLIVRNRDLNGAGLTPEQRAILDGIEADLRAATAMAPGDSALFLCRLFKGPPPTAQAPRRDWQRFTILA